MSEAKAVDKSKLGTKLLFAAGTLRKQELIDAQQQEQFKGLLNAGDDEAFALLPILDTKPWEKPLAEAMLKILQARNLPKAKVLTARKSSTSEKQAKLRLNVAVVKETDASPDAAQADELLRKKRERQLKRQSMPEKVAGGEQEEETVHDALDRLRNNGDKKEEAIKE